MSHISLCFVQILTFCLMCSASDSESGTVRANMPVSWPEAASAGKLPPPADPAPHCSAAQTANFTAL